MITRIATSYDQQKPLGPIDTKDHNPSPGLSQHDIDVIVGKAPPPEGSTEYDYVLGTVKPKKVAVIPETRPFPTSSHSSSTSPPS
jgi:hypothetical protein